jgi:hypothetical protein
MYIGIIPSQGAQMRVLFTPLERGAPPYCPVLKNISIPQNKYSILCAILY